MSECKPALVEVSSSVGARSAPVGLKPQLRGAALREIAAGSHSLVTSSDNTTGVVPRATRSGARAHTRHPRETRALLLSLDSSGP